MLCRLALHTLDDATRLLVSFLHDLAQEYYSEGVAGQLMEAPVSATDKRVHHTLTFFSKSSTILPTCNTELHTEIGAGA